MASFEQAKYCPNCKKNVSATKDDRCKICGSRVERGTWSVRFRIMEYDGEKQKRLSGFNTKKEALQAFIKFTSEHVPTQKTTSLSFQDALNSYFNFCKNDNSESTLYDKQAIFKTFITPYFQNKDINEITKVDLINWQNYIWNLKNNKNKTSYSWKYLTKIRGTFYTFLAYCENIYDIKNHFRTIKTPKNKSIKKDINFWEVDTFNKFINTVDDIMWNTLWSTFMYTGARFNEIRALKDTDVENSIITINKSLLKKQVNASKIQVKPTKNYKIIKKQIPNILSQKIIKYKEWKKENKISSKFLFGGDTPLSENCIRRRLREDIKKSKLSYISPHGFRHSYVSLLIHLGVNTKVIASLIGDREEQVIKTYGHLYNNAQNNAIELLNNKLNF